MLLDALGKLAVKCSKCGKYNIVNLNIFELKVSTDIMCDCGQRMFRVSVKNGEFLIDIDCIACEKQHSYKFKIKDIINIPINIISCPVTGMEIAFLGKDGYVDNVVERYMNDMYELLKFLGVIEERPQKVVK